MRVLMISPLFVKSFFTFEQLLSMTSRRAMTPPLGLVTVAALLPSSWALRLVDANARQVTEDDWNFAEMVMVSGMITQKVHQHQLIAEAKRRGLPVAIGGPAATQEPEDAQAAGADFLVLDEGEITIPKFLEALERGETTGVFRAGAEKADVTQSPIPRFDLLNIDDYWQMQIQYSRGCPFNCEFCDIPVMFGNRPRTKTPAQVEAELETLRALGWRSGVLVADDNFIGHKKNLIPFLEHLLAYQRRHKYPFGFSTEASMNVADDPKMLALLRDAGFKSFFLGIESPDPETLAGIRKKHNLRHPMKDRINKLYDHGFRVIGGMILGFDGEAPGADQRIIDFLEDLSIPFVILHMLFALPKTPLTQRLEREGRLRNGEHAKWMNLPNFTTTRPLPEIAAEYLSTLEKMVDLPVYLDRLHRNCLLMGPKVDAKFQAMPVHPRDVVAAVRVVFRHGVARPTRLKFWRLAMDVRRRNPRALRRFFNYCAEYEHLLSYYISARQQVTSQLATMGELKHQVYREDANKVPA